VILWNHGVISWNRDVIPWNRDVILVFAARFDGFSRQGGTFILGHRRIGLNQAVPRRNLRLKKPLKTWQRKIFLQKKNHNMAFFYYLCPQKPNTISRKTAAKAN
jgi:hypothetical protein